MSDVPSRALSMVMPADQLERIDAIARLMAVRRGRYVSRADIIREACQEYEARFFASERGIDTPNGALEAA